MSIVKLIDDQIDLHESMGLKPLSIDMTDLFFKQFVEEIEKQTIIKKGNRLIEFVISKYRGIPINMDPYVSKPDMDSFPNFLTSHNHYFMVRSR